MLENMLELIRSVLFVAGVVLVIYCLGRPSATYFKKSKSFILTLVCGLVVLLALGWIVFVPCILLYATLTMATICYLIAIAVAIFIGSFYIKKHPQVTVSQERFPIQSYYHMIWLAAAVVIGLQLYLSVFYSHIDQDDAWYVASATTALDTNTLFKFDAYTGELAAQFDFRYILGPYPIFFAVLGKLSGISPAIVMHTIMPPVLILLGYMVYMLIAAYLFPKSMTAQGTFVFFMAIISTFGGAMIHLQTTMLLFRVWQGKGTLAGILLPLLFLFFFTRSHQQLTRKDYFAFTVMMFACCMVSEMGAILGILAMALFGLLHFIINHNFKNSFALIFCCCVNFFVTYLYITMK